ncbi:hypothetical protein [Aliiruegeria sabulilitoris]|uniref:hypothetical protein n=1 Tax=Aliiruegeria sabulilitoris TaxID=1510458 RepID=UPI0012E3EFB1|nr:hypothetical protein [Aliiruegeria sabulilitoris]NDR56313.1 hypothetical protein [Pseudoruegeria sp. M32A2M]
MRRTVEALLFRDEDGDRGDAACWTGSVDFGYQRFEIVAHVEILTSTTAEMRLGFHRRLNGITLKKSATLTVPPSRESEEEPVLAGPVKIADTIWACGAWMHWTNDGRKSFKLKFVQMTVSEIEDLPRPVVRLTPPRWPH